MDAVLCPKGSIRSIQATMLLHYIILYLRIIHSLSRDAQLSYLEKISSAVGSKTLVLSCW
jgi:hypothetical protein